MRLKRHAMHVIAALAVVFAADGISQTYPQRPVRLVIPFVAGSGTDVIGRLLAQRVSESWGQSIIVDNRGGAAGNIAAEHVAKSPPDGYTILLGNIATHGSNPSLYKKLPYDPIQDFAPVTLLASIPPVVAVHPSIPARNMRELIALARAHPGELNYAGAGIGSGSHLAGELLKLVAKINMQYVPYKGSGQALAAMLGGETSMMFTSMLSVAPYHQSRRVRVLAVSGNKRLPMAPDIPTMAEAGVRAYDVEFWYGLLVPRATPAPIIARLNESFVKVLSEKDTRDKLIAQGAQVYGNTPEQFADFIRRDIAKWANVTKSAGIPQI